MDMSMLGVALGFIFGYILYVKISVRNDKAAAASYPIVGSFFSILRNRRRLPQWLTELLIKAPSHTIKLEGLGGRKRIITANPANVEHILKTRFDNYPKGEFSFRVMHDLLGSGIFNADGEAWKLQRKVASYEFSTTSLRDFIGEVVQGEITGRLLPLLRKAATAEHKEGSSRLDMQDVLKRFAFDNICKVAFGTDPGCLHISLPVSEFAEAFDVATELLVMKRLFEPLPFVWKVKRMLNVGSEKRLRQAIRVVRNFAQQVIHNRKKETLISPSRAPAHQDLLSRFLSLPENVTGVAEKGSYDDFVRDIVISFMLAGRDTTSAALTWFFWLVSSHPHVEKNIDVEIAGVVGCREEEKKEGEGFSYEEVKEMKYLHACICECMRLYPPVPHDTKDALEDDVLPDGTEVRKGTRVAYHPYAMGRMESIWGTDCLQFKPERWLEEDKCNGSLTFVGKDAFKYPVFQAGPRVCLGKEMAFTQMKCIAASVMREFSVKVDPTFKSNFVATLTSRMEDGLHVQVVKKTNELPLS